jgi:hypothetical protein
LDQRKQLIDACNAFVGDFLIEELWCLVIKGRCRHSDADFSIRERGELNTEEINAADITAS